MVIPEFYLDAVVSIMDENQKVIGSGFMYIKMKDQLNGWPYLVSNAQVFKNRKYIFARFQNKDSDKIEDVKISLLDKTGNINYSMHNNDKIDIAVIHINGKYLDSHELKTGYFCLNKNDFSVDELRDNGVSEGCLVYSLGYPLGLTNLDSKYPICRMGCIARMSEKQVKETNNILLDIQNFPGSSGSPVILRPELVSIEGTKSCNKAVLIGILHSYIPYTDQLISRQTGEIVEIRTENSGLANMHPVDYIREVIEKEYETKNKEKSILIDVKSKDNETRN